MKIPRPTDRRVLRTRTTLRDALIQLILERGWEETSVQDVCDRANVGRSTFYTHFADKEDLLLSGFEDLQKLLRGLRRPAGESHATLGFMRGLLEHAHDNKRLFRALVGTRSTLVVHAHFRQLVIDLTKEELSGGALTGPALDLTVHYLAGAALEVFSWWIDARRPLPLDEIESRFQQLATHVLRSARGA